MKDWYLSGEIKENTILMNLLYRELEIFNVDEVAREAAIRHPQKPIELYFRKKLAGCFSDFADKRFCYLGKGYWANEANINRKKKRGENIRNYRRRLIFDSLHIESSRNLVELFDEMDERIVFHIRKIIH